MMNGFVEAMAMANVPYIQFGKGKAIVRQFQNDVDEQELVWHKDKKDRTFKVISGVNWKFQHDNELPFVMKIGDVIKIKKENFHRVHKGQGKLIIEIEEHD